MKFIRRPGKILKGIRMDINDFNDGDNILSLRLEFPGSLRFHGYHTSISRRNLF